MIIALLCAPVPHISVHQPGSLYPHALTVPLLLLLVLLHLGYHPVRRRLVSILRRSRYGGVVLLSPPGLALLLVGAVSWAAVV